MTFVKLLPILRDFRLIEGLEYADDDVALQRAELFLPPTAKEKVAGEKRQIGHECPPAPARAFFHLREIERDLVIAQVARQQFLLPAAQVGHPPPLGHLENRFRIRVRLTFEDRHDFIAFGNLTPRPNRTPSSQREIGAAMKAKRQWEGSTGSTSSCLRPL